MTQGKPMERSTEREAAARWNGRNAFRVYKKGLDANPYPAGSYLGYVWVAGWNQDVRNFDQLYADFTKARKP